MSDVTWYMIFGLVYVITTSVIIFVAYLLEVRAAEKETLKKKEQFTQPPNCS